MTQYILLIHGNASSTPNAGEWEQFITAAGKGGFFKGGSAIGNKVVLGDVPSVKSSEPIVGYMRFDSDDRPQLLQFLESHPVVVHGGTVELCEMLES